MTVKEAVSLLHYGTGFEIKGAYSGKIYHSTRKNKKENLEKYYDEEVVSEPFYTTMCLIPSTIWYRLRERTRKK